MVSVSLHSLVPVVEAAGHHSNDSLPGHGGAPVPLQHHLPVVPAMGEDRVGAHADPGGVLSDAHCVAAVGDVGLVVPQVGVPEERCGRSTITMKHT